MGREIKRVVANFNHPLDVTWPGFLNPHYCATKCEACDGSGHSPGYNFVRDQWYGYVPFDPRQTGSTAFLPTHPRLVEFATRQCERTPGFYGTGPRAVEREAKRLCDLFNAAWSHHISQADVEALIAGNRLWDFTKRPRTQEQADALAKQEGSTYWLEEPNGYIPTAAEVNEWAMFGMGHDSINSWLCCDARCKREKIDTTCTSCAGRGVFWPSPEAEKLYDDWQATEPPAGDWWQVWQTVGEGSPVTPAFATAEQLIDYLVAYGDVWDQRRGDGGWKREAAEKFVGTGWAASMVVVDSATGREIYEPRDGGGP